MKFLKKLFIKIFKKRDKNKPWLDYYSRKDKKIQFTDKTIYEYMVSSVGEDKDYYVLNYFGTRMTYSEFFSKINAVAKSLRFLGVKPKDVITICMPNTPEAIICFYAINKIGAIADMIHPLTSEIQMKNYLNDSKSRFLILLDSNYAKFKDILEDTLVYRTVLVSPSESMKPLMKIGYFFTRGIKITKPKLGEIEFMTWKEFIIKGLHYNKKITYRMSKDDTAIILHSGGTTGKPKGIMISNYNFNAECQQDGVNVINVRPKDKILTILPIFHGFGLCVCVHCPICLKVETILMPEYDHNRFYKIWKNLKPHVMLGVPSLFEGMINNKKFDKVDMSQLKYIISGGDFLSIPLEEKINDFLRLHKSKVKIKKGYGMTESVAATAYTYDGTNKPGSIGIPMVGNNFSIRDVETYEKKENGVEGEICVNGPTIMQGYLNNESETKNVLKEHDGEIWLHTGDLGYMNDDGIIFFTGRCKRMIVSNGFNVYPNMIEEAIEKHDYVKKCCVIGIPHKYKIQVPKAFIVLEENKKPNAKLKKELRDLCKKNLAAYAIPKDLEFVESLPKTLYNKVDYKLLEKKEKEKYELNNK